MSKKKKKKLKKSRQSKNKMMSGSRPEALGKKSINTPNIISEPEVVENVEGEQEEKNIYEEIYKNQRYSYIKKDVAKVLVVLLILVVLLFAIYFLDKSYSFLKPVGDWLYKIMNIQTQ